MHISILHSIISIMFIVMGSLTMLFPKSIVRHVNKYQEKHQLKPPRIVEKHLFKQKESQYNETETQIVNVVFRIQIVVTVLGGAFFFTMGLLSLLGIIHPR